jgi:hypothetical protein
MGLGMDVRPPDEMPFSLQTAFGYDSLDEGADAVPPVVDQASLVESFEMRASPAPGNEARSDHSASEEFPREPRSELERMRHLCRASFRA